MLLTGKGQKIQAIIATYLLMNLFSILTGCTAAVKTDGDCKPVENPDDSGVYLSAAQVPESIETLLKNDFISIMSIAEQVRQTSRTLLRRTSGSVYSSQSETRNTALIPKPV